MGDKFFFCFFIVLNFIYILSITYILNFIVYDFVNVRKKLLFYYDYDKKLQCYIFLIVLIKIMLVFLFFRNSCFVFYSLNILE